MHAAECLLFIAPSLLIIGVWNFIENHDSESHGSVRFDF